MKSDLADFLCSVFLGRCERRTGLGALATPFSSSASAPLRRIVAEPERWRKIRGNNRKVNFYRFPYAIVYSLGADAIYVKAVMHLHRRPFYWLSRQPPA